MSERCHVIGKNNPSNNQNAMRLYRHRISVISIKSVFRHTIFPEGADVDFLFGTPGMRIFKLILSRFVHNFQVGREISDVGKLNLTVSNDLEITILWKYSQALVFSLTAVVNEGRCLTLNMLGAAGKRRSTSSKWFGPFQIQPISPVIKCNTCTQKCTRNPEVNLRLPAMRCVCRVL